MGSMMAKAMDDSMKKNQEFMLKTGEMQLERQLQMQNQMRERMQAMQIARARDMFMWLFGFGATYLTIAVFAVRRSKAAVAPILPLSFIIGYHYDLAYGSKIHRLRDEADRIMDEETSFLQLPHGLPSFSSIEEARLKQKEEQRLKQSHDIFL